MRLGWILAGTFGATLAAPLLGQANAAKVRLNDSSAPRPAKTPGNTVAIDQVSNSTTIGRIPASTNTHVDSSTSSQIGMVGDRREASQIGIEQQRSAAAPAALSSRIDGRPGGLVTLGGNDRCDPQLAKAQQLATCRRVIERRAEEFAGARPTQVSPEVSLLFPDRSSTSLGLESQSDRRVRSAVQEGDPDNRTNQELAAVATTAPPAPTEPQIPPDGQDKGLSQIIGDVLIQFQNSKP